MLNQINLDLLRVFQSTARTQSIKTTAKELGVTPSAISQALSKFEEQLGTQLFLREHKKIVLAQSGAELKVRLDPHLRKVTEEIHDFRARRASKEPSGTLAIGAPAEFGSLYIIKWFSEFQRTYPKVKIKLRLGSPRTLLGYLQEGEVDFLIADNGPYYEGIKHSHIIQPLFQEELVLCYSAAMGKSDFSYKSITALPHLDYSQDGSAVGIWYEYHFGKKPKHLDLVMVSENVRSLIQAVKNGLGVAMIPKYMIQKELDSGSIKIIAPTQKVFMNELVLVQHRDKVPLLAERLFLAKLRSKSRVVGAK